MITARKTEETPELKFVPKYKPSKYQLAIYDAWNNSTSNLFIEATAGSGKTSTLLDLLKQTPEELDTIFLAFNKSIAQELSTKTPEHVEVRTIHSLAFKVLRKFYGEDFTVENFKNFKLMDKVMDFDKYDEANINRSDVKSKINKIIDLYRMNLIEATPEALRTVCDIYNVSYSEKEISSALEFIEVLDDYNGDNSIEEKMIDFTDMLWIAYKYIDQSQFDKYDIVMVDEVQDVNPLQKVIIDRIIGEDGRFVAVGDKNQAIYSFMGSNLDSFTSFKNTPNTITLPLSVSYRCARTIVDRANEVFPHSIEAFEKNVEGSIRTGTIQEAKAGDFIICRNNEPLMINCLHLLSEGKKCFIKGKDFSKSLISIINSTRFFRMDDKEKLQFLLDSKETELEKRGIQYPTTHKSYLILLDKINVLRILLGQYHTLTRVKNAIDKLYRDDDDGQSIVLMTGHKAKGLENKRVFWLQPSLIDPSKAETAMEQHQEKCLKFVILTRAKEEIVMVA